MPVTTESTPADDRRARVHGIVLTRNEEKHIGRCLSSAFQVCQNVSVVDCGSTDRTVEIAREMGARVLERAWTTHAQQFNWALDQIDMPCDWVLRIDADEYLSPPLVERIRSALSSMPSAVAGITLNRCIVFLGRKIVHGGIYPGQVLRLFRAGRGRIEERRMDEHIVVEGDVRDFSEELIDENLNDLSWWVDKHNVYATREVDDIEDGEREQISAPNTAQLAPRSRMRRFLKTKVYARTPLGVRAALYLFYRLVLRGGFLDGKAGVVFHVLQGGWYRFLVDAKLLERRQQQAEKSATSPRP